MGGRGEGGGVRVDKGGGGEGVPAADDRLAGK